MFKELQEFIKTKKQQREEKKQARKEREEAYRKEEARLNKLYPTRYIYWGSYDKKVVEGDLEYTYSYSDYFLADGHCYEATAFRRLTGENAGVNEVEVLSKEYNEDVGNFHINGYRFKLQDDGNIYSLSTQDSNCDYRSWADIEYEPLIYYINNANRVNKSMKADARQKAIQQRRIDSEFEIKE